MTIKSLLFCLFLYVSLVWVGAVYLYSGPKVREFGLLWTAAGLVGLLVFIVGARILAWWRLWRIKASVRPAAPLSQAQVPHEDDAALEGLLAEANAALAKAAEHASKRAKTTLFDLPVYLLIGPDGSGKTSAFLNSGLEPQLLAGQGKFDAPVAPTRLCNIWVAGDSIFVEVAGRVFGGDPGRWTQLLKVLRGKSSLPLWRRIWRDREQKLALRGVIAFCGINEFIGSSNPERLERYSRDWRERLLAVGEVFGADFPVYQVITKCDTISFFPDYFRRLPEPEAHQVFGSTLPSRAAEVSASGEVFSQAEAKRLNRSFSALYRGLAKRRLTQLAHEPDPARRPAIYEFPRELKRIRSPLVQFLIDVFRPHTLGPGPLLRGYYLTGVREVEVTATGPDVMRTERPSSDVGLGATRMFRGDATQIFRPGDAERSVHSDRGTRFTRSWMFLHELFHDVVLSDHSAPVARVVDRRLEMYRWGALGLAGCLCFFLIGAFVWSWAGNRTLLRDVERAGLARSRTQANPSMAADLQSLETLRVQVARLTANHRNGPPIGLRWGLYSGDRPLPLMREIYFRRLQQLLLNDLNGEMVARLAAVPADATADRHDYTYRLLKTHLMISSGSCQAEPALASQVLREMREHLHLTRQPELRSLADRQIDFYAGELAYGNPCRLTEDPGAAKSARQYLRKLRGLDAIYTNLLASVEKASGKPQRLADLASNYAEVLDGPSEISAAFTRDGWKSLEKVSRESDRAAALGEPCVIGDAPTSRIDWQRDQEFQQAIQRMFVRDYATRWREFLGAFSLIPYKNPQDAARKLEVLSSHRSPLLALFAMVAGQTVLPVEAAKQDGVERVKTIISSKLPGAKRAAKAVEQAKSMQAYQPETIGTPQDIARSFQPVHWIVPPTGDRWIGEKNNAYMDALEKLRQSMQEIARGGNNPEPAVHEAAGRNYENALEAVRQIARGFEPVGDEALDKAVQRLLEEPILLTKPFIIADMEKAAAGKINTELRAFCGRMRNVIRKYPFRPSTEDITLEELAQWFAPGRGAVWQFQGQSLNDLTVKEGSQWKAKDPTKKPQVTQELLSFLNRSQSIADVFYPAGATQPHLAYTLRPRLDASLKDFTVEFEVNGQPHEWTRSLQKQFTWPPPPEARELGAVARLKTGSVSVPFASRGGLWGVFRIMGDAEPRPLASKQLEWKYLRGGEGRPEPINPAPVRLEIVEFPGGVDVFNPRFFEGLQCPARAVQ